MVIIGRTSRSRGLVVSTPPTVPSLDDPAEARRQEAVDSLGIVDTEAEERFDRIVEMARSLYHTDAAVFSVIDRDREWMKATAGTPITQVPRSSSFCSVIVQQEGALVVGDTTLDPRFAHNPGVVGAPGIRFYAGVPIITREGEKIGALCVSDTRPRKNVDMSILEQLALLVQAELRLTPLYSGTF